MAASQSRRERREERRLFFKALKRLNIGGTLKESRPFDPNSKAPAIVKL